MENKFFDDSEFNSSDNSSNNKKNNNVNWYSIILIVIGVIVLGFALFKLFTSDTFKKKEGEIPTNKSTEKQQLKDNDEDEDIDPDLYISSDVKEILDKYCSLMDLDGTYISAKMTEGIEGVYEMCSNGTCMTTVRDNDKGIYYYTKECNNGENPYRRIAKVEIEISNKFREACDNLDKDGNYNFNDDVNEINMTCKSYSCNLNYRGEQRHQSCVR